MEETEAEGVVVVLECTAALVTWLLSDRTVGLTDGMAGAEEEEDLWPWTMGVWMLGVTSEEVSGFMRTASVCDSTVLSCCVFESAWFGSCEVSALFDSRVCVLYTEELAVFELVPVSASFSVFESDVDCLDCVGLLLFGVGALLLDGGSVLR